MALSLAKLSVQPNMHPLSPLITPEARTQITNHAWPAFASLSWALVMYIFRWYPETLMSSLRSSMVYMYVVLPSSFVSLVLIMVQLLGLRPLGLFPQSFNTQQIDQEMVCSSVWRIEWGMRLFIMLGPCLFLMYIFRLGQLGYELSIAFKDGKIYSRRCISSWESPSGWPVSWNHDEYGVLLYYYMGYILSNWVYFAFPSNTYKVCITPEILRI